MEFRTGWIKDKYDPRDYLHKISAIPRDRKGSNENLFRYRRYQGKVGSCVGQGVGTTADGVKQRLGIFTEMASATWIYNGARFIEGTLPIDCGCYPKDALDWILKNGILLEHYWPYDPTGLDRTAPSSTRIKQADKYKGFAYFRCVDGIDGIADALAAGNLVAVGSPWFREWMDDPPCGRLPKPTTTSFEAGGHETVYSGWDDDEGVFLGMNSWEDWGDNGKFIMPYEAIDIFKRRGGYDAHYITFTKDIDTSSTGGCFISKYIKQAGKTILKGLGW
jgi:hypothetical protein